MRPAADQRLDAAERGREIEEPGRPSHVERALLVERDLLDSRSSFVITTPPATSLWPLMYFVVEWSTRSAPNSGGNSVYETRPQAVAAVIEEAAQHAVA